MMKQTNKMRLSESHLHNIIKTSLAKVLRENIGSDSEGNINLDGSVIQTDEQFGEVYAANIYFDRGRIVVRWITTSGSDCTSLLLDEDEETIWSIIQSIG